jgi:ligand-binding SRPBCC domain-containing protein
MNFFRRVKLWRRNRCQATGVPAPDARRWGRGRVAVYELRREQWIPREIEEVFAFFSNPVNLGRITPGWLNFRMLTTDTAAIGAGTRLDYELGWHGIPIRWQTEIVAWKPPGEFADIQRRGPYLSWHHTHRFRAEKGGTLMTDVVRYELPLGMLGRVAHTIRVRRDLERVFDYRSSVIAERFPPLPPSSF